MKAQLYIRGSGPLRKSVERQSDTTMTSNNDTARSVNDNPDDNSKFNKTLQVKKKLLNLLIMDLHWPQ